jgi:hypothetical protein
MCTRQVQRFVSVGVSETNRYMEMGVVWRGAPRYARTQGDDNLRTGHKCPILMETEMKGSEFIRKAQMLAKTSYEAIYLRGETDA